MSIFGKVQPGSAPQKARLGPIGQFVRDNPSPPPEPWEPKYPNFTDEHTDLKHDQLNDSGDVPWVDAPPASHVLAFRLYDLRKFTLRAGRMFLNGKSQILVRFKPSGKRGVTEYKYTFTDPDVAAVVFDMLADAEHPGVIVHSVLIANKVPYDRMA